MSKFVLSLLPDGKAILTTEDELTQRQAAEVGEAYKRWHETGGIAVIAECRVQRIDTIELLLRDHELVQA